MIINKIYQSDMNNKNIEIDLNLTCTTKIDSKSQISH